VLDMEAMPLLYSYRCSCICRCRLQNSIKGASTRFAGSVVDAAAQGSLAGTEGKDDKLYTRGVSAGTGEAGGTEAAGACDAYAC
jgi:hypothetical protein